MKELKKIMITINKIKELMHICKINQSVLAKDLGIDKATISNHLSGKLNLSRAYKAAYYYYFNLKLPVNFNHYLHFFKQIELFEPETMIDYSDVSFEIKEKIKLFEANVSNDFNEII